MTLHSGSHFRRYLRDAPWYIVSSVFCKLSAFGLLPVYSQYLNASEIGALSIYESLARLLTVAISLYLDSAFIRFYFKTKHEKETDIPLYLSSHFWFAAVWGGATSVIILLLLNSTNFELPDTTFYTLLFLIVSLLFGQLCAFLIGVWVAELQSKHLAVYNMFFSAFTVVSTLVFIMVGSYGWESKVYALFLTSVGQIFFCIYILKKKKLLIFAYSHVFIVTSLKHCIPLLPNLAGAWIVMFSDRLILNHYGTLDEVGVYSIAAQLSLLSYILSDALTKIQGPLAMSGLIECPETAKKKIANFFYAFVSFMSAFIFLSMAIVPVFVNLIFGDAYSEVPNIFYILAWIYLFTGVYRIATTIISYHNKMWVVSIGAILQAIVNVFLNLMFIPEYGMYGAAFSSVFSVLVYTAWLSIWVFRLETFQIEFGKLFVLTSSCIISLISALIVQFIDISMYYASVCYSLISLGMFFVLLNLSGKTAVVFGAYNKMQKVFVKTIMGFIR